MYTLDILIDDKEQEIKYRESRLTSMKRKLSLLEEAIHEGNTLRIQDVLRQMVKDNVELVQTDTRIEVMEKYERLFIEQE